MIAVWPSIILLLTITISIFAHFTQANMSGCRAENDTIYWISWPSTPAASVSVPCPRGTGNATRVCNSDGEWESPVLTNCSSYGYSDLTSLIEQVPTENDLISLATELAVITNTTEANISLYPNDLMDTNTVLHFLVTEIISIPKLHEYVMDMVQNIIDSFSNVLNPTNNPGWMELHATNPDQSQILLMNAERLGLFLAENSDEIQIFTSENIVIEAKLVDANDTEDFEFLTNDNSATIPANYIQQQSIVTGINPVPVVGMNFKNIENLLPVNNESLTAVQPISQVLSTQVINNTSDMPALDNAIQLTLQYSTENLNDPLLVTCGYWNFSMNNGRGGWDTEGVTVLMNDINNSTITCRSTYSARFAVLADLSGGQGKHEEEESRSVHLASYIGCGISLAFLLITAAALIFYRKNIAIFTAIHGFIHLNMVVALSLALVIFVSGIEAATNNEAACEAVAILLHYFFTAAFMWQLVEAILFFAMSIVSSIETKPKQMRILCAALGWGVPVPIVVISAGVAHDQYGHDDFCWISTEENLFWGVVASIMAIFITSLILLMLSFCLLYTDKTNDEDDPYYVLSLMKSSTALLFLLGITWAFSILAVNQESSAFDWLFALLNSFQGMLIFILYVFNIDMSKESILLCCRCILPM